MRKQKTDRHFIAILFASVLLFSGLYAYSSIEKSYAADGSYISDVVFWDTGNGRMTRDFGFNYEEEGPYEVAIDDNARTIKAKIAAGVFQSSDIYCQIQIGDVVSDPEHLISGQTTEITAPLTIELAGNAFRLGDRKIGSLVVGQYDSNTATWSNETTTYTFSFVRRIVINSVVAKDSSNNRLILTPSGIEPNTDTYTIAIPETSGTVKLSPTLTIRDVVRDEEDPEGTLYRKTINYEVPEGAIVDETEGAVFDISKLNEIGGKPYIDAVVGYDKDGSDIKESSYRFLVDRIETQPEIDHTPTVIMEGEREITCDKDADVEFRVSAQTEGESNLTYQWFEGSTEENVAKRIDRAETDTYHPETNFAKTVHPGYYRCRVTNTVDGKSYVSFSGVFKLTVRCSYLTPPEIIELTEDKVLLPGNTVAFDIRASCPDLEGSEPDYSWYINDTASTEGAEVFGLEINWAHFPGSHGTYLFNEPGSYYVYCIVTATIEDKIASTTSPFIKITVEEPEDLDVFNGEGTEESPYLIDSLNDLENIRAILKTDFYFKDKYFKLTTDISLPSDWQPIGELKEGTTNPDFGSNIQPFSGNFNGNGHTVTVAEGGKPLFGYVRQASIKNLKIQGSKINGHGLIDNYAVDYGVDGEYGTGTPNTCDIENVTILSGSSILKSGFVGGYGSGRNIVTISNCSIQSGVTIGYTGDESCIGSFSGEFNGTITNSHSAADVFGKDCVGGLVGRKGQSMGLCKVTNSYFTGTTTATGKRVGGIIGSGYDS